MPTFVLLPNWAIRHFHSSAQLFHHLTFRYSMRRYLPLLLALAPLAATAQSKRVPPATFLVQGNLPATTARMAYLYYKSGTQSIVDSVAVRNGRFEFKGVVPALPQAQLVMPAPDTPADRSDERLPVFLERGVSR